MGHTSTLVAAISISLGLAACDSKESGAGSAQNGEEVCASKATRAAIQDALFDGAVAKFEGEPLPINDMRRLARSELEYVELDAVDENTGRADCSARFKLAIPVNVQDKFGDEEELLADITYATQNAADGSGREVDVDGLEFVISKIVNGFSGKLAKPEPKPAPTPEKPRVATYNPSFPCTAKLNRVERMVCEDRSLSQLDRQLSATYDGVMLEPDHEGNRSGIKQQQNAWRARRDRCPDKNCVEKAYRERIDFLYIHY